MGEPAQTGVSPTPVAKNSLFGDATARFAARPTHSPSRDAVPILGESAAQAKCGRTGHPKHVAESGRIAQAPNGAANQAFRFGVHHHHGEMIACDDLKHARANLSRFIPTQNILPTWDRSAQHSLKGASTRPSWSFYKEDHAPAYKWLPLQPDQARYATVILRPPLTSFGIAFNHEPSCLGRPHRFFHYTCLSRIIASSACRLLGIPMLGYLGDFGAVCRSVLSASYRHLK